MATHVILGAGPAGMHAIETIRKYDPAGSEIHLVCDEPAYSRMVLPYWMAGEIEESHVLTANDGALAQHRVTPHIGCRATAVDAAGKRVTLSDGSTLAFDTLLIATGSSATRPPISGADQPGVHNLWTLGDARAVMPLAQPNKKVLFVGAGFIGLIVLNALFKKGCRLAVVELESQVLPRMLDAAAASLAQKWLEAKGVELHTGTSVTGIERAGDALVARLASGRSVDADCVIISTGIRTNVEFLQGSGIALDRGVLVDHHLRTNFPYIYAAGDCAQGPDLLQDGQAIHAIQPTAIDHGRIAGANMAGGNVRYDGSLLMNVLDICGLQGASFGRCNATGESLVLQNDTRPIYRKLILDGDRITGAILLGRTSDLATLNDMGMIKGFIQTQTPLGEWKSYLQHHPLDVRRAYVATSVATKLLDKTLLPDPTTDSGYRHRDTKPDSAVDRGPYHAAFADTFAAAKG
jgi:NAD(P)H-nitrite reductase large subunit